MNIVKCIILKKKKKSVTHKIKFITMQLIALNQHMINMRYGAAYLKILI